MWRTIRKIKVAMRQGLAGLLVFLIFLQAYSPQTQQQFTNVRNTNIVDESYRAIKDNGGLAGTVKDLTGAKTAKAVTTRSKTVAFQVGTFSSNGGSTKQNTGVQQTLPSGGEFNFKLVEDSVVVKNAFVDWVVHFNATTTIQEIDALFMALDVCQETCSPNAWTGTNTANATYTTDYLSNAAEENIARFALNVTTETQLAAYTGGGVLMSGQFGYCMAALVTTCAGTQSVQNISYAHAVLYITYEYDDASASLTNTVVYPLASASSTDSGSRKASVATGCTLGSNCPKFNYNIDVPEVVATTSVWFGLNGAIDSGGTTDFTLNYRVGTNATGSVLFDETLSSNDVQMVFGVNHPVGFDDKTAQTLEMQPTNATVYTMGGEVFETYTASSSAAIKTRTINIPLGNFGDAVTTTSTISYNIGFPETGVVVKSAWTRIAYTATATVSLGVNTKIGSNATTTNTYTVAPMAIGIGNIGYIYDIIPTSTYAEIASSTVATTTQIQISTKWSASPGATFGELMITYTYTDESTGYFASHYYYGGNTNGDNNSPLPDLATSTINPSIPESSGVTMARVGLRVAFIGMDSDDTVPLNHGTQLITADLTIGATVASGTCTQVADAVPATGAKDSTVGYITSLGINGFATSSGETYGSCFIDDIDTADAATGGNQASAVFIMTYYVVIVPPTTITVSGTVYSDAGVTTATSAVKLVVGSTTQVAYTTSTDANGAYIFTTVVQPQDFGHLTVWMNNNGGGNGVGSVSTKYSTSGSGNVANLDIYKNLLIVRHEDAGDTIGHVDVSFCDKTGGAQCADSDLHYEGSTSTAALTVDNDIGLLVWGSKTYQPNGALTLLNGAASSSFGGDFRASSSVTIIAVTNNISIGGDMLLITGTAFSASSSQVVTMTATSTGYSVVAPGGSGLENLTFNGVGGSWSATTTTLVVNGDMTFTNGTLDNAVGTTQVIARRSVKCGATCGIINMTNSSHVFAVEVATTTATTFGPSSTVEWNFMALAMESSVANTMTFDAAGTGDIVVSSTLTLGGGGGAFTANFSNRNVKIYSFAASGRPFVIDDSVSDTTFQASTSNIFIRGDIASIAVASTTYYNLTLDPTITASRNWSFASGTLAINNNFLISPSSTGANTLTVALTNPPTVVGTTTITRVGSALATLNTASSSKAQNLTTNRLTLSTGGTLAANTSTVTITATSGLAVFMNGGTHSGSSTFVYNGDGSITMASTTYWNLSLTPGSLSSDRTYTFASGATNVGNNFDIQPGTTRAFFVNLGGTTIVGASTTLRQSGSTTSTLNTVAGSNHAFTSKWFSIGASSTLQSRSSTITITDTVGQPFTLAPNSTFVSASSTFVFNGNGDVTVASTTYWNLTLSPTITASRVYTGTANTLTVNNDLTVAPTAASDLSLTFNLGGTTVISGTTLIQPVTAATSSINTTSANDYALTLGVLDLRSSSSLVTNDSVIVVNGTTTVAANATLHGTTGLFQMKGATYTNNGTFTHNSGTFRFNGSLQQTATGTLTGASAFNIIEHQTAFGSSPTSSPSFIFGASVTAATSTIVAPNQYVQFASGTTATFTNIDWNGQLEGTRAAVFSTQQGGTWNLVVSGSPVVHKINAMDSNACGGSEIDATDGTNLDSGNNPCWNFTAAGVSVSGTVYIDEGITTATSTIKMVIGGTAYNTSTDSGGVYTFTGVTVPATGTVVTVWMNNNGGGNGLGATVSRYSGDALSGLDIYKDRLIVRHEDPGPVTNIDIGACDKSDGTGCADSDLHFEASTTAPYDLTVDNDWGLYIWTAKTYAPSGTVTLSAGGASSTTGGDLEWASSTSVVNASSYDFSVGGDWDNRVGGTHTRLSGHDVTFTATQSGMIINAGSGQNFGNVVFNGSGGTWSATTTALTATGTMTLTNGTINNDMGSAGITVTGNALTGTAGTFSMSTGTVTLAPTVDATFGDDDSSVAWTFNNLTLRNTTTSASGITITTQTTGLGPIQIGNLLRIGAPTDTGSTTLNAGGVEWFLSGTNGDPFQIIGGSALTASTSLFNYLGDNPSGTTTVQQATYALLKFSNPSEIFSLEGNTTSTTSTVEDGTLDTSASTFTTLDDLTFVLATAALQGVGDVTVGGDVLGAANINLTGGTFLHKVSASSTFLQAAASTTFNNLQFDNSGTATVIFNHAATTPVVVSGTLTIGGNSNGLVTLRPRRAFDINTDFSLKASGTLDFVNATTTTFTVARHFENLGNFNSASTTFTFDTTATSTFTEAVGTSTVFWNLNSQIGGKELQFASGTTWRVNGQLALGGTSGSLLRVRSTSSTSQWFINHQGTESVSYTDIQDSGCNGASTNISVMGSTDNGNNGTCWLFPSLSFTISTTTVTLPLNSGNSLTTNATTTLTVTSRSGFGYTLTQSFGDLLTAGSGGTISNWGGTYGSPTTWSGTCIGASECGFGYNTDDADISQFSAGKYAAFTTSTPGDAISSAADAVTGATTTITFRSSVSGVQPAGDYRTTVYYVLTPQF